MNRVALSWIAMLLAALPITARAQSYTYMKIADNTTAPFDASTQFGSGAISYGGQLAFRTMSQPAGQLAGEAIWAWTNGAEGGAPSGSSFFSLVVDNNPAHSYGGFTFTHLSEFGVHDDSTGPAQGDNAGGGFVTFGHTVYWGVVHGNPQVISGTGLFVKTGDILNLGGSVNSVGGTALLAMEGGNGVAAPDLPPQGGQVGYINNLPPNAFPPAVYPPLGPYSQPIGGGPATYLGGTLNFNSFGWLVRLNDNGQAVYLGQTAANPVLTIYLNTTQLTDSSYTMLGTGPTINDSGTVAFFANRNGATGIYTATGSGNITPLVLAGATSNGLTVQSITGDPFIDQNGRVVFVAALTNGSNGIFSYDTAHGLVPVICYNDALSGAQVTGFQLFRRSVDAAGHVAFTASLSNGGNGVFLAVPGTGPSTACQGGGTGNTGGTGGGKPDGGAGGGTDGGTGGTGGSCTTLQNEVNALISQNSQIQGQLTTCNSLLSSCQTVSNTYQTGNSARGGEAKRIDGE